MKIAFLGLSTNNKRFLLLCLAKIASFHTKVTILTKHSYCFGNINTAYEYCGIEIILYKDENELLALVPENDSVFIDAEDAVDLPEDYRIIAVCEPTRQELELSVNLTNEIILHKASLNVSVLYLNIMEYSKVSKRFLDLFWERGVPNSARITFTHAIYFEDINHAMMIDSQYSNKIPIKGLSLAFKGALKGILQDIFKLDSKSVRDILKKAEREK